MINYRFDEDVFRATFDPSLTSGAASAAPLGGAAGCGDKIVGGGSLASGGTWLACGSATTPVTTIRRLAGDGSLAGDARTRFELRPTGDQTLRVGGLGADARDLLIQAEQLDPSRPCATEIALAAATSDADTARSLLKDDAGESP